MSYHIVYVLDFEGDEPTEPNIEEGDQIATGKGWLGWITYVFDRDLEYPQSVWLADKGEWEEIAGDWPDLEHEIEELTHATDPNVAAVSARLLAAVKARPDGCVGLIVSDGTEPDGDDEDDEPEE